MRQFSLPPEWRPGAPCVLEGGRARYLARVLRLEVGDVFPGIDPSGGRWLCELAESGRDRLVIAVRPFPQELEARGHLEDLRAGKGRARPLGEASLEPASPAPRPGAPEGRPRIILAQGIPKGTKMDLIVRQAAEAGVIRITPILARRSVAAGQAGAGRLERWRRIAREALQQSGSATPTRVDEAVGAEGLAAAIGEPRGRRLSLLLDAEALAQATLHGYLSEAPDEVVLCVGPEGGFDARESRAFAEAGFVPLKLPCAVLRTETAALYAVAAVEIVLSEHRSWIPAAR